MNVGDSRRLAESLEQYGLRGGRAHDADVVVLYSCVVRPGRRGSGACQLHALQR